MPRCALVLLVALAGCSERDAPPAHVAPQVAPAPRVDARDLIAKLECARCHEVPEVAPAPQDKHCVGCHQQIHAGTFAAKPEIVAKWRARITSLRWVPSLASADRLRRDWVRRFLLAPHDVRPGLAAEMPRLAITEDEAARLAAHLVPDEPPSEPRVPAHAITRGEALFRTLACGRCHRFTGASVDDPALHAAGRTQVTDGSWELAPDLRYARERMTGAQLARWIAEPRGAMPKLGVSRDDAELLAAFISLAQRGPAVAREVPARLPVLARDVTWDEVSARVFRNLCWHCHAEPDFARGDGGPGTSGGFGFAPRGLDVSSYAGISAGSLDDAGERRSIFATLPDGTPRLVAHLMARHREASGGRVDGVRGMPLGLPPLSLEDIQLVESWIAQGRPR